MPIQALLTALALAGQPAELAVLAVIDAGKAPHQIAFDASGETAFVAAPGSSAVAVIDVASLKVLRMIPAASYPMGAVPLPSGEILVSRFRSFRIARLDPEDGRVLETLTTGGGPSLFTRLSHREWLVTTSKANRLWIVDANFNLTGPFDTGARPFHASATSDGKLAFVPSHDDGTVTVVDLDVGHVRTSVAVGAQLAGGVVLPDDTVYAVAVAGEDRIALMDTASESVTHSIEDGVGEAPFFVAASHSGSFLFTANTRSHDLSVIDVASKKVALRVPVGPVPVALAVHPSGETLWVASEGSHTVTVLGLPSPMR